MHLVAFQVLDRDGFTTGPGGEIIPNGTPQAPPGEESGWKDTAMVAPNEILRVIARFDDYEGAYPYHCHILEHEDNEMMRQFVVPEPGATWMLGSGIALLVALARRRAARRGIVPGA
jgi:spore coat protein A